MLNQEVAPSGLGGTHASPAFHPIEFSQKAPIQHHHGGGLGHPTWPDATPVTLRLLGAIHREGA